jgi:hypothetical protein
MKSIRCKSLIFLLGFDSGDAPAGNYTVNEHDYTMGYYQADDIYPLWSKFVKTIQTPTIRKQTVFPKLKKHDKRTRR